MLMAGVSALSGVAAQLDTGSDTSLAEAWPRGFSRRLAQTDAVPPSPRPPVKKKKIIIKKKLPPSPPEPWQPRIKSPPPPLQAEGPDPSPSPKSGDGDPSPGTKYSPPSPPVDRQEDRYPPAPPTQPNWPPVAPSPPPKFRPPSPPEGNAREIGRYDFLANSMIVAVHIVQIPGTDNFLFMERPSGYHPDGSRTIAGYMDMRTGKWRHIFSPDGLFCCGHTLLETGDVVIVGGHQANAGYPDGMRSVRTFNKSCTDLNLRKVNDMGWRRWYPTATLLPPGWVMIMGGTQGVGAGTSNNPFWEMYYPATNELIPNAMRPQYLDQAEQVYYPFNYVLPSGYLFTFCGRSGWIIDYMTNTWITSVPRLRGYGSTQFPFTGTSVMLGLYPERNYEVEIMLFGGQKEAANKDLNIIANRGANRLKVKFDKTTNNFTFDEKGWAYENMPVGRVMPDSVLLPNGKVVILNGANAGLAGDSAGGGDSRADYPVLHADIYDPDAPQGNRFRKLAYTKVARMYHSVACLTTDGTVIVAGCDRCYRFKVYPEDDFIPSPTSKAEYRTEIFRPPYTFFEEVKPIITSLDSNIMHYGEPFVIRYTFPSYGDYFRNRSENVPPRSPLRFNKPPSPPPPAPPPPLMDHVTQVVIVSPCSCTHSFNPHQRLIGLRILSNDPTTGTLVVEGPPHMNIAIPGMYMVFVLNGDIYSTAKWVTVPRPPEGATGWRWGATSPNPTEDTGL